MDCMKPVYFIGTSREDLKNFPEKARWQAGTELYAVQTGKAPADFKPMSAVGAGVYEIRIHCQGEWRVFYVARFSDAVYVLHAFRKKSRKTGKEDIDIAARRYKQIRENRNE